MVACGPYIMAIIWRHAMIASVRSRSRSRRIAILVGWAAIVSILIVLVAPAHQDQGYHLFAPSPGFGQEHFWIVATNIAFLVVGTIGLLRLAMVRDRFPRKGEIYPYLAVLAGFLLVAVGSAIYHLAPQDATLVWDRAAMVVIFAGLVSIFATDRIAPQAGPHLVLPVLMILGLGSQIVWRFGGDLRLYWVIEVGTVALIPAIVLLFDGRRTRLRQVFWMAACFSLATATEFFDHQIHAASGGWISGHALKHLLAAAAGLAVIDMLPRKSRL